MKRLFSWILVPLLAASLAAHPMPAAAAPGPNLDNIQVKYHGGPLLRRVRVITLFWGPDWKQSRLPAYLNSFFRALFADGRFMANLAQYSTSDYTIENGVFGGSYTDPQAPPSTIEDSDVEAEIRDAIDGGHVRKPDENTVYFVFTPPKATLDSPSGTDPEIDFSGYHQYAAAGTPFAYAVIRYDDRQSGPALMTMTASHELAEAVTDPEPELQRRRRGGWYDENNGEIGDIPQLLFEAGRIDEDGLLDELDMPDGSAYLVQKQWSLKDAAPIAFAAEGG